MADEEHLRILQQGVESWNQWRKEYRVILPDLSRADLRWANLSGADLWGADLDWADLSDADLSGAHLHLANLSGANLSGADLSRAHLQGAILDSETQIDDKWRLVWLIVNHKGGTWTLGGVDLSRADLTRADLRAADLSGADLTWANLNGAELMAAHLSGAHLDQTDLTGAHLSGAHLTGDDLTGVNLSGANLRWADLSGAHLSGAHLDQADLTGADLTGVDLSQADLSEANLSRVNLDEADLSGADLRWADLRSVNLREAKLSGAQVGWTVFGDVNLGVAKGLEFVIHEGPSTIGIDTVYASQGRIPEVFLRGAGVPDEFITYLRSLVGRATEFYSCFISYSSKDQDFAERLHADLQARGVRCWFAPEDIQGGRKLHEQIAQAIRRYDRLLLVLSENSMGSEWVKTEIYHARQDEIRMKRRKLFPISLVSFQAIRDWTAFDADTSKDMGREVREYFIPDFSSWKDHDAYKKAFDRLLRDLTADR